MKGELQALSQKGFLQVEELVWIPGGYICTSHHRNSQSGTRSIA